MNTVPWPAALAWTSVYLGLFGFYLVAGHRFPRRGYARLAGVMLSFASASFLLWAIEGGLSPILSFLAWRALVLGGALGPPLHTDFVLRFTGLLPRWSKVARASYACALAFVLADFGFGVVELIQLYPDPPEAKPMPFVGVLMAGALLGHVIFSIYLYLVAFRGGQRRYIWLLGMVSLIGPAVGIDYAYTFITGSGMYISELAIWVYGLAIALVLLLELRGAEGLLAQTASSLRERTHELEISYAELEFVQSELTQKQQLAAVGELAQAIAHEVRNPLAVIVNAASGLRRQVSEKDRQTLLSIIDEEAARLNQLVTELLRFARPMRPATAPVHVEEIYEQIRARAGDHELVFRRAEGESVPELWVDPELLRLALDSVVQNAAQAMAAPSRIEMVLRPGNLSDGSDATVIEVRDAGRGMPADVLERAKKPFFTTRPRGTGLGLSIVERIVEAHGGELELRSTLGKGTTVLLRFPRRGQGGAAGQGGPLTARRKVRSRFLGALSERSDSVPPESVPPDSAPPDSVPPEPVSASSVIVGTSSRSGKE
jgi:signal transduction histidine kinase